MALELHVQAAVPRAVESPGIDPFVRDAFRLLLADERLHAQSGFHYLESRRAWLEAHPEVVRSLGRFLRYGFALERFGIDAGAAWRDRSMRPGPSPVR